VGRSKGGGRLELSPRWKFRLDCAQRILFDGVLSFNTAPILAVGCCSPAVGLGDYARCFHSSAVVGWAGLNLP
jgi:hypothetical protein